MSHLQIIAELETVTEMQAREHEEFRRRLEEENKRQDTRIGIL